MSLIIVVMLIVMMAE